MIRGRKRGKRGLDIVIGTSSGVSLRIMERPGLWMEASERAQTLAELRDVARRGTGGKSLEYGILSGAPERWDHAMLTVLREDEGGRLVGFSAMSLLEVDLRGSAEDVVHLGLVMLDPAYRGSGCSRMLYGISLAVALIRRRFRPFWVSNVTQVPAIVGMVAESLSDVYPSATPDAKPLAVHLELADQIMARHRAVFGVSEEADFDDNAFVIRNAYTGGSDNLKKSYAEAPLHRHQSYNDLCQNALDYRRGDDFLQLGRFTPAIAFRCVQRFLSRSRRRQSTTRTRYGEDHGDRVRASRGADATQSRILLRGSRARQLAEKP